jgi:outer membrane protease
MTNSNFATDLRLISNRQAIEINNIKTTNEYEARGFKIAITKKYATIVEALEGLYELGIEHNYTIAQLVELHDHLSK